MSETELPKPPRIHDEFVETFPDLADAWSSMAAAGEVGPIDQKAMRLIKLAVAMGAMREGAVHASVRKALALGITKSEIHQVVALASSTIGLPAAAACFSWVSDGDASREED